MKRLWMAVLTLILCSVASHRAAAAETTLIRELAKNKPNIIIITSGPLAADAAQTLQHAILSHADNKNHKPDQVPILSIADGADAVSKAGTDKSPSPSVIFLLVKSEVKGEMPAAISGALPVQWSKIPRIVSVATTTITRPAPLTFSVAVVATDKKHLENLVQVVLNRRGVEFRNLPFTHQVKTNRIALFCSPDDKGALENWGRIREAAPRQSPSMFTEVENDLRCYALDARATLRPEELDGCDEAYFVSRSRTNPPLPDATTALLSGRTIKDVTTAIVRGETPGGAAVVLFSAPNGIILRAKAAKYPSIDAVPTAPVIEEVKDLRAVQSSTLIVWGTRLSEQQAEDIRFDLERKVQENLKIQVEKRGPILERLKNEIATQELLGRTDTGNMLRAQDGLRYIWVLRITEWSGSTEYKPEEQMTGSDAIPAFSKHEPQWPTDYDIKSVGGGRKAEEERKYPIYQADHKKWVEEKDVYEEHERRTLPVQWERKVVSTASAHVSGILQLIDIRSSQEVGSVLWERNCQGAEFSTTVTRTENVTMHGVGNRPNSLQVPDRTNTCDADQMLKAAYKADLDAVKILQETAWLPDGTAPPAPIQKQEEAKPPVPSEQGAKPPPPDTPKPPTPPEIPLAPPGFTGPKVAQVKDGTVILKIEPGSVHVGDKAEVATKLTPIPDPDDAGKVLRWDVDARIILRVVRVVENTADCVPANKDEAAKIDQVKPGMAAVKVYGPPQRKNGTL